ncbi:MAG TPA: phosphatase PAP2 family protein [Intrasporangium sp.]|nr:phosphatase PAP2 family protein [Intrasporangium sp.]
MQDRRTGSAAYLGRTGRAGRLLKAVGYGLLFAVPVTLLAFFVREKFLPLIELDRAAIRAATDVTRGHDWLRTALLVWQEITQPRWLYIVGTVVCLVVWRRFGLLTRAAWAFVTMMVAWNLQLMLKLVVQRARPVVSDPVSHAPGYSFPSGHAANAAAVAAVLLLLLWPLLGVVGRRVALALATLVVIGTALDRVYLGVHFPSDVVAGILFGVGLAVASYAGYLGWNPASPDDPPPPEGEAGPERDLR